MRAQEATVIRITQLCRLKNITINHLADCAAISPSTLKNVIYGNSRNTGVTTIAKICDGFEISLCEFFDDEIFRQLEPEIY